MNQEEYLKSLLEIRDAESSDSKASFGDGSRKPSLAAAADLQRMNGIRIDLRDLPELSPPDFAWQNIQSRLKTLGSIDGSNPERSFFNSHMPVAIAASFFLISMFSVLIFYGQTQVIDPAKTMAVSKSVGQLIDRSQALERTMQNTGRAYFMNASTRGAFLQRINDVDAKLSRVAQSKGFNSSEARRLWQQRVDLMQSMIAMERPQQAFARQVVL